MEQSVKGARETGETGALIGLVHTGEGGQLPEVQEQLLIPRMVWCYID